MSGKINFDKEIYELECSYSAVINYEERITDGIVSMAICKIKTPKECIRLLDDTIIYVRASFVEILIDLKRILSFIDEEIKSNTYSSIEIQGYITRIIDLNHNIRNHETSNEDLIRITYNK